MKQYFVYVIELDPVVADLRKFRAKNPKYISGNYGEYIEELFVHELVHASLDKVQGGYKSYQALNPKISKEKKMKTIKLNWGHWRKAQKKDKRFITKYAKTNSYEDLAESFLMWLALRYNRVSDIDKDIIIKTIPNRIDYFDKQSFDMYPLVSRAQE